MRKILACGTTNDVAIVQVEGGGFAPLPLAPAAPAGSAVWVLSHPLGRFYSLSTGIVSGYIIWPTLQGDGWTTWMNITADYAGGSSGAPVVNGSGAVVGIASKTETLYPNADPQRNPQMVMKFCVPSAALLELIEPE